MSVGSSHTSRPPPTVATEVDSPTPEPRPWDADQLWRDRVQLPRLAEELMPTADAQAESPRPSCGWDPFRIWQERVLYGREVAGVVVAGSYSRTSAEPQVNPPPNASSKAS